MLDTNNNISPDTTDYAELPDALKPLTPRQILGLRVLSLSDGQVKTLIRNRSRRIIEDAIARREAKRKAVSSG